MFYLRFRRKEKEKEENGERKRRKQRKKGPQLCLEVYYTTEWSLFDGAVLCWFKKKSISVNMQVKCSPGMSAVCGTKSGIQRMSTSLRALYPGSCLVPGILSVSNFYFPLKKSISNPYETSNLTSFS